MRSLLPSARRPRAAAAGVAVLALAAAVTTTLGPASAQPPTQAPRAQVTSVTVHRGGPDRTVTFHRAHPGEVFLHASVSAPGVSWAQRRNESAVVSAYVDGHYATDIVIMSASGVARDFALGHLGAGRHTLRIHYADRRSPSNAGVARLRDIGFRTVRPSNPAYVAAKYAPVLYGRTDAPKGRRPLQNNHTDTPLIAWHQTLPAKKAGHSVIEYSVAWSNEDGGTPTPALMAQWGRTTDIEWIYRVEVDAQGRRVAGTGRFQGANHATTTFRGRYDGTHPVLQTCTSNNNVCDTKALQKLKLAPDPMRFALDARNRLAADQPREHEMDVNPWTYQIMGREMVREGKVTDTVPDPSIPGLADQRTYLYLAVDQAPSNGTVGLAVDVVLQSGATTTTYTSDHLSAIPTLFTIHRRGPAATTIKLPPGTTPADILSISARRVLQFPAGPDSNASVAVTAIDRAFFLGSDYLPLASFAQGPVSATLTQAAPTQVIWPPAT